MITLRNTKKNTNIKTRKRSSNKLKCAGLFCTEQILSHLERGHGSAKSLCEPAKQEGAVTTLKDFSKKTTK